MALDSSALADALEAIFDGSADNAPPAGPDGVPASAIEAGMLLAAAYFDYASAAMFGASTPVFAAQEAALAVTLGGSLAVPGLAATHAAAWGAGLTTFWTGVTVAGVQAGATVPPTGAAALVAALTALFSNPLNTAAAAATGLATALDTCTKTVQAAVAPPPGTMLPIA